MSANTDAGQGITIREGRLEDLDAVVALERATEFAPHWGRAVYRDLLVQGEGAVPRILMVAECGEGEAGRRLVGFATGAVATSGAAELESVVVTSGMRRAGIGFALCQAVMRWSAGQGAEELLLEVRSANKAAFAFYARLGFRELARRPNYYADPADDAVVMQVLLTESEAISGIRHLTRAE